MKTGVYFLLLLLLSAQADDVWAVAPISPSAPLADDDEFLVPDSRPCAERSSCREKSMRSRIGPRPEVWSVVGWGMPSEWKLTSPFVHPPLYVFMSLQI